MNLFAPNLPLVSCLCITHNRTKLLGRSISCFLNQTYPNKELVIVHDKRDLETKIYIKTLNKSNIWGIEIDGLRLSLGQKRNISIRECQGEYFCQWDDDDWCHNNRIESQLNNALMNGKPASVLAYKLLFDNVNKKGFLSQMGPWPGTILCKKELFDDTIKYPSWNEGEDEFFAKNLYKCNYVYPIIIPELYIYVYHGNNTCSKLHFDGFFQNSQQLSRTSNDQLISILDGSTNNLEASKILSSSNFRGQFNFFHHYKE